MQGKSVQAQLIESLRQLVLSMDSGIREKTTYGIPFFYRKKWVCYINPKKDGSVDLGFTRGKDIYDPTGLLQQGDRKMVGLVPISSQEYFDKIRQDLMVLLYEAIQMDEEN